MKTQKETQCAFIGCTNTFIGPPQQKYCLNQQCIVARKLAASQVKKTKPEPDTDNIIISNGKFKAGTILKIQCSATGPAGRCSHDFVVVYDTQRTVYPKYCEDHRNKYRRDLFEGKVNAKPKT